MFPDQTFEALIFDWDGTAVPDRRADGSGMRRRVEALCRAGVDVAVVSGTHVDNVDGQLGARPRGPGRLFLCLNRGSEVFEVGAGGPELRWRRAASKGEEAALTRAALRTVAALADLGVPAEIVSRRLNRTKIDLIPEPRWSDPPKARIGELVEALLERLARHGIGSLAEVVDLARREAMAAGVSDPRITSDAKHVEIGLTDKSDSARWILGSLLGQGVGAGLVAIVGDEFGPLGGMPGSDDLMLIPEAERAYALSVGVEPEGVPSGVMHVGGGPEIFLAFLDEQLLRRRHRRVPSVDQDPAWTLAFEGDPKEGRRMREAVLTLAESGIGTRGALEEDGPGATPLTLVAGVFVDGEEGRPRLLAGPGWTSLEVTARRAGRRVLDLRSGVLWRERSGDGAALRTLRFASATRSGVMAMRAEGRADDLAPGEALSAPDGVETVRRGGSHGMEWLRATSSRGGGILAAAHQAVGTVPTGCTLERLVAYAADPRRVPRVQEASGRLREARRVGFDALLREHREAWARRWDDAEVHIEGDPDAELAVRFALFHLMASASDSGEAAMGARGVTGDAYAGHVFWDADVYALPVLAAVRPGAARAMLEYRIRRLPAAQEMAAERDCQGARFPWESADDGLEATPPWASDGHGGLLRLHTGERADHIVADVAWSAVRYAQWTGDTGFLAGPGRQLVTEAARYFASRVQFDGGRGHLYAVIGPDEYHEVVDDNAFTNVMARWTLRTAAGLVEADDFGGSPKDVEGWRHTADALVDGFDEATGLYEQFAGFFGLEPLVVSEVADVPVAADLLLGRDRVARSQVLKQADVLMLHFLVPDEVAAGSLVANLDFYGPRTAHGSSLSPAIHAALLARAGRPEEALSSFRLAARLDLDDLTGTTAGGLHLATMGGLWQALVHGFLGLCLEEGGAHLAPVLPEGWRSVDVTARVRGRRVRLHADASGGDIRYLDDETRTRPHSRRAARGREEREASS